MVAATRSPAGTAPSPLSAVTSRRPGPRPSAPAGRRRDRSWGLLSRWCRMSRGSCSSGWCRRRRRGLRVVVGVGMARTEDAGSNHVRGHVGLRVAATADNVLRGAATVTRTRYHPPHRPQGCRVLTAAGPPPLDHRARHGPARLLPTPPPTLRTQSRLAPPARDGSTCRGFPTRSHHMR